MSISMIVAHDINGGIGKDNKLLWKLPRDMRRFREKTMGNTVVMGRKTHDSIGKPLPGRKNIVLTRSRRKQKGITTISSKSAILAYNKVNPTKEIFIIGGSEVYKQFLPYADTIHLTLVYVELDADSFFPSLPEGEWKTVDVIHYEADEANQYDMTFKILKRI
jgi:dihydrofolate reductase